MAQVHDGECQDAHGDNHNRAERCEADQEPNPAPHVASNAGGHSEPTSTETEAAKTKRLGWIKASDAALQGIGGGRPGREAQRVSIG